MKKNLLLLCFLAPCCLSAQNWMPVVPGETYHYRLEDSAFITHTIRVDSTKKIGNDSVYYLNRILQWYFPVTPTDALAVALRNQGQFLGKTMTKTPDSQFVFQAENYFFDTTFILRPLANPGESWLAVPGENITATVTAVVLGEVLGEPDSLKTIQFGNGAQWVLSKNHGLVRCPDFNSNNLPASLSGLETKGIGDRLYRFEDFFDFNAGDVYEYASFYQGIFGTETTITKYTILAKETMSDTFRYQMHRIMKITLSGFNDDIIYKADTVITQFVRPKYLRTDAYNSQLISLSTNLYFNNQFSWTRYFKDGIQSGEISSSFTQPIKCPVLKIPDDFDDPVFYIDDALTCSPGWMWGADRYFEEFRPKLGRVKMRLAVIDNTLYEDLTGSIVQGDTIWGNISPDWIFTATKNLHESKNELKLYPNPAMDFISLEIPESSDNPLAVQVFDAAGRLLRTTDVAGQKDKIQVDLSGLPAGFFMIIVRSESEIWRGKLHKIN